MKKIYFLPLLALVASVLFLTHESIYSRASFFNSFVKNANTIGALTESSESLAQEITKNIPKNENKSIRILEVGAGTGVFTKEIIKILKPGDELDVVELMPNFVRSLKMQFNELDSVNIYKQDILDFQPKESYDVIISGLPFNSFKPELTQAILDKYKKLSKAGALLSFFEYKFLPNLRMNLFSSDSFRQNRSHVNSFVSAYCFASENVWQNIPPAIVYHLLMKG